MALAHFAQEADTGRWVNNGAENSDWPFRQRKRAMLRIPRMQSLQKFAAVQSSVHNHSITSDTFTAGVLLRQPCAALTELRTPPATFLERNRRGRPVQVPKRQ
ncbi:MAG: hypothetical protein ACU0C9_07685 [Paracoccaceae bacterium]